ncbi:DnaB-like helicase C-terminal domain-containing protein [Streptomyces scabiei]|uniref:DnaB-like helicase C-terminal domain-containing protein n=1 Tax=Streptomyces scabiei TaxID=1930 RepID=UPI00298F01E7|nr:DnaB-like helicase C-terminal domain-containing protein [Streptomyces scabiei]MDW8478397.1 DnaB-like helicase C-terminal domain-containing protein [Streptomyces scabiei]
MVRNHARKTDARRGTQSGEGSHRRTVKQHVPKPRVRTGLTALDELLGGGLRPGRLTVVAANTAMGKSMLALTMARNCAIRQGRPAQVASLEMSNEGLLERTLAAETGVLTEKMRRRTLDPSDFALLRAFAADADSQVLLSFGGDGTTPGVAEIERGCATVVGRHGHLDLLVVDYLGLMDGALQQRASGDRQKEVASVVADLQQLATRLKAAVVIVEQLTEAPELRDDHRPRLSDLCHGEALLSHAEAVILLHRPAYYDPQHRTGRYERSPDPELYPADLFPRYGLPEPAVQRAELLVPHNRHGRTGSVEVGVELARARFFDRVPQPVG